VSVIQDRLRDLDHANLEQHGGRRPATGYLPEGET
jgi:hypothetical protein